MPSRQNKTKVESQHSSLLICVHFGTFPPGELKYISSLTGDSGGLRFENDRPISAVNDRSIAYITSRKPSARLHRPDFCQLRLQPNLRTIDDAKTSFPPYPSHNRPPPARTRVISTSSLYSRRLSFASPRSHVLRRFSHPRVSRLRRYMIDTFDQKAGRLTNACVGIKT